MANFRNTYDIIDSHEHIREESNFKTFLDVMDTLGIAKVLLCATGSVPDNTGCEKHNKKLFKVKQEFPDRVICFPSIVHSTDDCVKIFNAYIKKGAEGLKLMIGHSDYVQEPADSPRMYKLYELCAKNKLPVLLHSNLCYQNRLEEFERALKYFSKVKFIIAHFGILFNNLSKLAMLLNKYPNLYTDCSTGHAFFSYVRNIDWATDKYKDFFLTYKDRILWGSDQILWKNTSSEFLLRTFRLEFDVLEKEQYSGKLSWFPKRPVFGLNLSEDILKKIYLENPTKIFKLK